MQTSIASRQECVQWATAHQHWRYQQWRRVLFSDESRFCILMACGRVWVWGRRCELYTDTCVMERDSWGGQSIMVLGEPSGSVIKLDLLSFRILTQVEVMASRLCSISIKSFDFILCSILASTSITGSSRTRPEPPWTFSSSTTSESCHDLPSVWIWIQQSTCKDKSKENSMKCDQNC